jgi:hypothetical protein
MAEIPIDQAADQIAAGTVAPTAEQHMLDTDGNPQIVDPGSVRLALQKGYKLVPQAVAEHVAAVHEAGEHPIEAGLIGAAQGAVPFAPSIIQAAGGPNLEEQRNLAEGNPLATTAGKLAGNVGQAVVGGLLTGGASDVAEAGAGVFDVADMAKQAAIFGGQGASNEINEQDLGDHGYNGEAVVSQAGLGALLGAASSPAFALAKEVLPNPITAAGKAIAKASDALTGALGRTAGEGGEAAGRRIAEVGLPEAENESATAFAKTTSNLADKNADGISNAYESLRPSQLDSLADQDLAQNGHTVLKTKAAMDSFRTNAIDPTMARIAQGVENGELDKTIAGKMQTALQNFNESAQEATSVPEFVQAGHQLGKEIDPLMKYGSNISSPAAQEIVSQIEQGIRTPLRQLLRDPEVFGVKVAEANGALTDAAHALFQSQGALYKKLGFTDLLADGRPAAQRDISPSRMLTFMRGGDKLSQTENRAIYERWLQDSTKFNDVAAQMAKDGKQTVNTDEIQDLIKDVATKRTQGEATSRLAGGPSMNGGMGYSFGGFGPEMVAGLAGHAATMATGVPGLSTAAGVVTRGVRAVLHPASSLEMLGKIKALADGHTAQIAKAASSFFTGTGRVVAPVVAGNALRAGKDPYEDGSDTEKRMAEVRNLTSNPTLLSNTLMRNTSALADGAPIHALAVQTNAQARLKVLQSALPPEPPQGMVRQKYPQSIDAVQKFETTLSVVNQPAKAIQAAMIDENMTPDMVAAADASAPKTMAALRSSYQNEMVDRYDHDYTLGQKQMLSVLFKAPVTPDIAPTQVAFLQATFAPPAPTPPAGGTGKPSTSGLAKLNPGAAIATPTQSRQMERA